MSSVRSLFEPTFAKKLITRFWPIWGLYTLVWLFALPLNLLLGTPSHTSALRFAVRDVLELATSFGVGTSVFFGLVCAMAVWSFLYNNRAAALIHALPVTRRTLFITAYVCGLLFLVVPNCLIALLTLAAEGASGVLAPLPVVHWLLVQSGTGFVFFSLAAFCAHVTGHILALPAFYGIVNGLAWAISSLITSILDTIVYGFVPPADLWEVVRWFTPAENLARALVVRSQTVGDLTYVYHLEGWRTLGVYVGLSLAVAVGSFLLYRSRQLETAGEVVSAGWLRPVFKYGFAFCSAGAFGLLVYEMFSSALPDVAFSLLALILFFGVLGYFAAEMLLRKSFRVFRGSWKGCAVFSAALALFVLAAEFDLTGYERRVPALSEVSSVTVDRISTSPQSVPIFTTEDPAALRATLELHSALALRKETVERDLERIKLDYRWGTPQDSRYHQQLSALSSVQVTYTLQDGSSLSRDYVIPITQELINTPATPAALLADYVNRPWVPNALGEESLSADRFSYGSFEWVDSRSGSYITEEFSPASGYALYQAALADQAAGRLGRRWLLEDEDYFDSTYALTLRLEYRVSLEEEEDDSYVNPTRETSPYVAYGEGVRYRNLIIHVQTDSTALLAALEEQGVAVDLLMTRGAYALYQESNPKG